MTNQKNVTEHSKNNAVKLEIETTEKVYALLKMLAKKDRRSIKNYVATSLYMKMEGDIDYMFPWADNPERKKHFAILRTVYPEANC